MDSQANYEAIPIGLELGPLELVLDEAFVRERAELTQWQAQSLLERGIVPPGFTISHHARMKFDALPQMRVSIWARSEQEFLKPMKLGGRVCIRGRVVEKYLKRGRRYLVTELETTDETGDVVLRSRETGIYVE